MKAKITKRIVSGQRPGTKAFEIWDTELRGLLLRIQPTGMMTYYFNYKRADGRNARIRIGDGRSLSPEQARATAAKHYADALQGGDPARKKVEARVRRKKDLTLGQFLDSKYSEWVDSNLKDGPLRIRQIKTAFPKLLDDKLSAITTWKLEAWRVARRKGKTRHGTRPQEVTLNRQLTILRSALDKAIEWEHIPGPNPVAPIKAGKVDGGERTRTLMQMRWRDL